MASNDSKIGPTDRGFHCRSRAQGAIPKSWARRGRNRIRALETKRESVKDSGDHMKRLLLALWMAMAIHTAHGFEHWSGDRPIGDLEKQCYERQVRDLATGHERGLWFDALSLIHI